MRIRSLLLTFFSHETENFSRIEGAINSVFMDLVNSAEKNINIVEGHYGNKIIVSEYRWKFKYAQQVFLKILQKLSSTDIMYILTTLDERMEGNKLYLRLDKQLLIKSNILAIKEGDDVIRLVSTIEGHRNEVERVMKEIVTNRALH
jgi:RNA binding exosome subunit